MELVIGWTAVQPDGRIRPMRRRLSWILITLTLVAGGLFIGISTTAYLWLERSMLDDVLSRELDIDVASGAMPQSLESADGRVRLFRPRQDGRQPPAKLTSLPLGSHLDVAVGEASYHVMIRDLGPGDRIWLLYNVEVFERRERRTLALMLVGIAAAGLLSWLLAGWAARHALHPLDSLVGRITALGTDPHDRLPLGPQDGELAVIVMAVNRMLSKIQALVDREQAFAGAAAHELRTPITSIRLAAELLAASGEIAPSPLLRIQRAVSSASQDLDALLALSESRQLPKSEPVPLHDWLLGLAEPFENWALENGTELKWQLQPSEHTLPLAPLRIIISNLLRNALRAAPSGEVTIALNQAGLAIVDNGSGIDPKLLPHIFEPGTRGPDGGSGIGLYIARTLAQRCGWTLKISSEPGIGTRAEVRF